MPQVKAASLVLDYGLYPRHETDSFNVNGLIEAMKAGATLPPVLVDRASGRVVDGFHRVKAHLKLLGVDAMIAVTYRNYASEAEIFEESARLNSQHGNQLTSWDKALCIVKGEALGLSREAIGAALSLTPHATEKLVVQRYATHGMEPYTLKRTAKHLGGRELTTAQHTYNEKAGGLPQLFYVNQVALMLELGTVEEENEALQQGLGKLFDLLQQRQQVVPQEV